MILRIPVLVLLCAAAGWADGERDNQPDNVRRVPPPGIAVPEADKAELNAAAAELGKEIDALRGELQGKAALLALLPDVQIYHNAIRYALAYNEIFNVKEIPAAKKLLAQGKERAQMLRDGKPAWTTSSGNLAFGYVSRIDGSVQPYGLVVPATYKPGEGRKHRLDTWFHGRGENLSELSFIDGRQKSAGEFAPKDAFVLHLYGRYCCANKLAGEVDLFEALADVQKRYPIDENRIVVRGFSMGGAACWQFAVHFAGKWAAAAPGAGFSETADFLKVFQNEAVKPTDYEQKLWHIYDCTDYALNLFNCPTVAYSGEIDKQKQAADMMAKALAAEGMELTHLIGPKTAHSYEKAAKEELNKRIDAIVEKGRDPMPRKIKFTTWTLMYPEQLWVTIDGLEKHWERARIDAEQDAGTITATTKNISALSFTVPGVTKVTIDGQELAAAPHFRKVDGKWSAGTIEGLVKRAGLQGPIDHAFMDSFLMVKPTGTPMNEKVGAWAAKEMEHAIAHWRQQYRGEARTTTDAAVGDADIAAHNLVLWGDPSSNKLLARIADKLPIRWSEKGVTVGSQTYAADTHVPLLIYPNPLNPKKYVVLNSGFTFREYDYLNNARQVPKLPDWAVIDVSTPANSRWPGKVVAADFFNEKWELAK